ncbi:hypothetical protein HMPREF0518_1035 [Lactobacillus helveticus DSM 20075 = CGMCC 1.1877]|uniref:Uncharacterized protein n=1 Tax=Lactobacillus ultunensis DSM 16047 TaxID=525365 RepID=C2EQC1_9LACO|nr:hypothetical protein HMPREF0548_1867 [Lactobacillus ultunensis DSM 16047]EEW68002.1 hypothetical protein HMPREF0518_1035 [Lactobacillus helveticus DSM 20075 = CGMCC 1.1877]
MKKIFCALTLNLILFFAIALKLTRKKLAQERKFELIFLSKII